MNNRRSRLTAAALAALFGPLAAQAQYDYRDIGVPGQTQAQVFGINDSGDVVGTASDPDTVPFVFSSMDGTITPIAPAAGFLATTVIGINDAGELAGSVTDFDGITSRAFIRGKKGAYEVFSHPDSVNDTTARAINNRGLVTGTRDTVDNTLAGFLYDPRTGAFTDLVPSAFTIAQGISSKGDVVGDARYEADPCGGAVPFDRYGWVRDKDGSVVLFQVNGQRTAARGINDAGKIVGFVTDPVTGTVNGFVTDAPTENCADIAVDAAGLLAFPGATATFAEAITNSGEIVGIYFDALSNVRGFIATQQ